MSDSVKPSNQLTVLNRPTPTDRIRWRQILDPDGRRIEAAYLDPQWLRTCLMDAAPWHDIHIVERWIQGDTCCIHLHLMLNLPTDDLSVDGIGAAEPLDPSCSIEALWQQAKTNALANALLELGMGLDIHGLTREPDDHPVPDLTPTDYWTRVKGLGFTRQEGNSALAETGGNRSAALGLLQSTRR